MNKTYYITTPLYYPSNKLHIGNAYPTIIADTVAKYRKLRGYDTCFLTGTDEHGQKIERVAKEKGLEPKEYLDGMYEWIVDLWKTLHIDYDIFIRTTDGYHKKAVQKIFRKLYDQGDIYKHEYEGQYCIQCETFFTERQLVEGKCPDCGRGVEPLKEVSYFFKLSKYQDRLMKHIEETPEFIMPPSRLHEMVNNFLKPGLSDLCVSRTSFKWGVPVDFDPDHVIYVWVDALSNYINALGYFSEDESRLEKYWPADVHVVGKEITRFHTIIWPIILMALELPLPKQVYGHGWLTVEGKKMGKSFNNSIDPNYLVEKFGVDATRYYFLRDVVFGSDGDFSYRSLISRCNSELANDLGNLLSRTVAMVIKYFDGRLPDFAFEQTEFDGSLIDTCMKNIEDYAGNMDMLIVNEAFGHVFNIVRRANKYIDETAPWTLAKDSKNNPKLAGILYNLTEILRISAILLSPALPVASKEILRQLCVEDEALKTWASIEKFGQMPKNTAVVKGDPIFPRYDIEKELDLINSEIKAVASNDEKKKENTSGKKTEEKNKDSGAETVNEISIDDFAKICLKVGLILECEKIDKSDKLLKSKVKIGSEVRQIVSGIAKHYEPEQMVGKKVVVVCNLAPVKLRGVLSEGMILAASDECGNLNIVTVDGHIEDGSGVR